MQTKISDIPGFSENAPKKKITQHDDAFENGCETGKNITIASFSELTVEVDEENFKSLTRDFAKACFDAGMKAVRDNICVSTGLWKESSTHVDLTKEYDDFAKAIAQSPQRFLRIVREK